MKIAKQYAALPYIVFTKHLEVLLITRRRSKRWIIPKGWPEADLSPRKLAELEAFEEAGLKGQIRKKVIGSFRYVKQLDDGSKVLCNVEVFPLEVSAQMLDWPEKGQRRLSWQKPERAADLIEEIDLAELIRNFSPPRSRAKKKTKNKSGSKSKKGSKKAASKAALRARINATL